MTHWEECAMVCGEGLWFKEKTLWFIFLGLPLLLMMMDAYRPIKRWQVTQGSAIAGNT